LISHFINIKLIKIIDIEQYTCYLKLDALPQDPHILRHTVGNKEIQCYMQIENNCLDMMGIEVNLVYLPSNNYHFVGATLLHARQLSEHLNQVLLESILDTEMYRDLSELAQTETLLHDKGRFLS